MQPMTDNVFDFPTLGASSGTLKPGMQSAEVADLQRSLQRLGFVGIKADGVYDVALASVVKLVQRAIARPETGEVDSFTEASITRALDSPQSMEAVRIGVAAREWSQGQTTALGPQQVQVVRDEQPFYLKPGFWLAAAGAVGLYFLVKRADIEPAPIPMGPDPDDGVDDPEAFFGTEDKPKKKRRRRKQKALAGPPEVVDEIPPSAEDVTPPAGEGAVGPSADDVPALSADDAPVEAAPAPALAAAPKPRKRRTPKRDPVTGAFLAKDGAPKKPRKKRRSRALAETAPAPDDEIVGEPGDPDDG